MASQIKMVLDNQLSHLKFDKKFVDKILKYDRDFVNKNEEHITFFGSVLFGVHVVRFEQRDRNRWYDEILNKDERILQTFLYQLRDPDNPKEPLINTDFNVRSDVMNISIAYLIHKFLNEKSIDSKTKENVTQSLVRILIYKYLTSLFWSYFKYPANPQVAEALYNSLTLKFELKKEGTWYKYVDHRAKITLGPKGLHFKSLLNANNDESLLYFLTDTQGRIRGVMKTLYKAFDEINRKGLKISSVSSTIDFDGEPILKDRSNTFSNETRYIVDIVGDRNSFIKDELVNVINDLVNGLNIKNLVDVLEFISKESYKHEDILKNVIIFSFNSLKRIPKSLRGRKNISLFLYRLNGTFTASRGADSLLISCRKDIESIIIASKVIKNNNMVKNVRTATMLYIVARVMAKDRYT